MEDQRDARKTRCDEVAAVVVTFNPDEHALARLLAALRPQVGGVVVVDNGSRNAAVVAELVRRFGATLVTNEENRGIAAAQNQGIRWALGKDFGYVLLSDQDSIPASDMVAQLVETFEQQTRGSAFFPSRATLLADFESEVAAPIAAIGPVPLDARGDSEHALVYSFTTWGARRDRIPAPGEVLEVPFVLASGCLMPNSALREVGPMNESLFIDHVDLAWCLRAIEKGFRVLVDGSAHLTHSLGEDKFVLPGGREVHVQSSGRNYFMVRNTLLLQRASFLPFRWKLGYLSYLGKYLGFYLLAGLSEPRRLRQLWRGLRDGLAGRGGPAPS